MCFFYHFFSHTVNISRKSLKGMLPHQITFETHSKYIIRGSTHTHTHMYIECVCARMPVQPHLGANGLFGDQVNVTYCLLFHLLMSDFHLFKSLVKIIHLSVFQSLQCISNTKIIPNNEIYKYTDVLET